MNSAIASLPEFLGKAQHSPADLARLNQMLSKMVPFNAPHGFEVAAVGPDFVRIRAPYQPANWNHIQGIHACAIATIAELSSALLLFGRLNPVSFRPIMARLELDYHYQAKTDLIAESVLSPEMLETEILAPLRSAESLMRTLETKIHDSTGNLVATAHVTWQIKSWDRVKTQLT